MPVLRWLVRHTRLLPQNSHNRLFSPTDQRGFREGWFPADLNDVGMTPAPQ